ncbi:hypothetical protein BD413DRAFT_613878 [Trametes elegans]|nr:hypothetical protein BD413DRAFT_613878 [Trametes elegans]
MPMVPSSQPRTTDTHALSSSVPSSLSSSSLSSSFHSSRASSDLLPAAPPSNSSQSDIITSDRSVSSLSSSSKPRFFPLALTSAPPRSASLANMGQSQSRPALVASPPPLSPAPSTSSSTGGRLKRAWAGRRKKSEDITALFSGSQRAEKSGCREADAASAHPPSAMPDLREPRLERPPSRGAGGPKLLNFQNVFGGRRAAQQPKPGKSSSPVPPPPPPKPSSAGQRTSLSPPNTPAKDAQSPPAAPTVSPRPSVASRSPEPKASSSEGHGPTPLVAAERPAPTGGAQEKEKEKVKEDWRKSDSTMASHNTIRPGALSGNRSPRPVSLAESSHSATTIVPPVNKRLSALITDAEFTMFEEADTTAAEDHSTRPPASGRPSPTSSLKARNRRSASLNLGNFRKATPGEAKLSSSHSSGRVLSDSPLSQSRDTPTLTRTAAAGYIAPVHAGETQPTDNNIRGRLAAWSAAPTSPPAHAERPLPAPPPPQLRRQPGSPHPPPVNPLFRQTAVSMTGSLAPAAGFAMGFGKRAVEKVGRAWGGFSSSASNHSGYSSSSSTGAGSTSSVKASDAASGYASSHHSGPSGWKGRRKVPHGVSGGSSISSFTSTSSEDHFMATGPNLGRRLRGPRLSSTGRSIAGGLVFKRDLQICVRETAIDEVQMRIASGKLEDDPKLGFGPVEVRLLPAIVVRCAQHIHRWGLQEEGLFRVSGRSSHVARLRSEFDAGTDYDLTECEPSDLDPHAVASIFKTFLRELPEPLLTTALQHYFESALSDDQSSSEGDNGPSPQVRLPSPVNHANGSNLPLRKPPSLSTLAMPSLAGMRPLSEAQVTALSFLISRLPRENRDLLYTVVELIKATAAHFKETKMPLGNLLLVFCPSLNMSPALLRVLCEANNIWNGPPERPSQEANRLAPAPSSPPEQALGTSKSAAPAIDLRLPVVELEDVPDDTLNDSPGDDGASFVSALEPCSKETSRNVSPAIYNAPIPPLSSSESLDSSAFSDELVSPEPPSCKVAGESKSSLASDHSLNIPETTDLSLPTTPRLNTDVPVPFPSAGGSAPSTPSSQPPLSHRKSYTLLSFSHPRSESSPPEVLGNTQYSTRRPKRPSLHLLFSKKSSSSLPSASGSTNTSAVSPSSQSGSIAISAPRPMALIASSPPRLDTAISSSPIHLGFVEGSEGVKRRSTLRPVQTTVDPQSTLEAPALDLRSDSGGSSVFSTPQSTPIADFYRGRATSLFFPETSSDLELPERARSASQASDTPSLSLDVPETPQDDDWMQSVLLAAQAGQTVTS